MADERDSSTERRSPEDGDGEASGSGRRDPAGPADPMPGHRSRRRSPPRRRDPVRRGRRWLAVMVVSLAVALTLGVGGRWWLMPDCEDQGCPAVERLQAYRPPEPPRIYDREGELAGQLSGPQRIVVALDSVPELVRDGYVAVEDRRFRDHDGVDLRGALRAFVENLRSGGVAEGASTITMQLARNVFGEEVLEYNRWHRKLSEIRLAREIEAQLGKEEILGLYLNQIYLGDGVYGVETAARHYFGKSVSEVNTTEAALLVGLAKNPEGFNPRRSPERARERIAIVLDILVRDGLLDPRQAEEARDRELELAEAPSRDWGANAYYLSAVRRELRKLYPHPADRRGLRVHTGLDARAQAAAVEALTDQIAAVEAGKWGRFRHPTPSGALEPSGGAYSPYLQGMVVAMDANTGLVTTLVGGRDYHHSEFDRAFQALRQPGSAFKPIVYLAALGQGLRLSEEISTDPVRLARAGSQDWEPRDHVGSESLRVRDALVFSSNSAAVRVGQRVGIDRVVRQAEAMGIGTPLPRFPSVFLGAGEVIPAELVGAYATFGNGGRRVEPHLITRIEDGDGRLLYRSGPGTGSQVVDPAAAFLVLDVMRDVVRRGTGWRVRANGLSAPAAGKTGTTNESRDLWFVGMTPGLVAGVWLGFDKPATVVAGAGGGDLAAPVWARFMAVASREGGGDWRVPPGVVEVSVDAATGYRATPQCPESQVRTEYFLSGTEPRAECLEHGRWERLAEEDRSRFWWLPWNDERPDTVERREALEWRDWNTLEDSLRADRERRLDSLDGVWGRRPADGVRNDTGGDGAWRARDRNRETDPDRPRIRPADSGRSRVPAGNDRPPPPPVTAGPDTAVVRPGASPADPGRRRRPGDPVGRPSTASGNPVDTVRIPSRPPPGSTPDTARPPGGGATSGSGAGTRPPADTLPVTDTLPRPDTVRSSGGAAGR